MKTLRIISFVLDTRELKLFLEDGGTFSIPQGDPRLNKHIPQITEDISKYGIAVLDFPDKEAVTKDTLVKQFEELSNNLVKFFRASLNQLDNLPDNVLESVSSIMTLAQRITSVEDMQTPVEGTTVVAVVEGDDGTKSLVPNVERLAKYIAHSANENNTKGVTALLKRVALVHKERAHSAEDLLSFLEKANFPITDNGDILALRSMNRSSDGKLVDIHTGKVKQQVGSIVEMPSELVDGDRHSSCSHGLHVASAEYVQSFRGNALALILVKPEDVYAVPLYETTKMRCSRYQVLMEFTDSERDAFYRGKVSNYEFLSNKKEIFQYLGGHIPAPVEVVHIGGRLGTDISVCPITKAVAQEATQDSSKRKLKVDEVEPKKEEKSPFVSPAVFSKTLTQKEKVAELVARFMDVSLSPQQQIDAAKELVAFKRKARKGWTYLGVTDSVAISATKLASQ